MNRLDDATSSVKNDAVPTECEECRARSSAAGQIDRRGFVTQGALAAIGALLLTACAGGSDSTGPAGNTGGGNVGGNGSSGLSVTVSAYPALAAIGGIARIDSGQGTPVAAVRTSATTFSAFSLICPHFGCTVGIASGSFQCPCHGARFAATGQWTGGQQTGNLTSLNASYDATTDLLRITG
ncbi:MAG: Rieske (2Fe-2S) protein [Gemmatimonadaceae bacterium]